MLQPKLFLMLGYPGAGKTTVAEVIHDLTGAVHISSDKERTKMFPKPNFTQEEHDILYRALDQKTEELLRAGKSVIYDANLNRYQHRQDKYDICARANAQAVLLWVQAPKDLAKQRATSPHRHHLVPSNESPDQMFDRISGVIELPGATEPYLAVDGTKVNSPYIKGLLQTNTLLA